MIFKFTSVLIPAARVAQARVSAALTAGEVAALLQVGGLEIATPLAMADRLGTCGIAPGDRLAIFTDEARKGDFPAPVRTGGREVTVRVGPREISTGGRTTLTIGAAEGEAFSGPDIDLREASQSSRINLLPAQCAALLFDGQIGQWFAALTGGARVLLDDYELTQQPVPISGAHTLRFFPALDDPTAQPPLAQIRLTVAARHGEDGPRLPVGPNLMVVRFGTEYGPYNLRASDNVRVGQVADGLSKQNDVDLTAAAQVYRLRVAASHIRVSDLLTGEQLYVGEIH